jgi:hypothetical protein
VVSSATRFACNRRETAMSGGRYGMSPSVIAGRGQP